MRQTGQAAERIREFSHAVYFTWRDALRRVPFIFGTTRRSPLQCDIGELRKSRFPDCNWCLSWMLLLCDFFTALSLALCFSVRKSRLSLLLPKNHPRRIHRPCRLTIHF